MCVCIFWREICGRCTRIDIRRETPTTSNSKDLRLFSEALTIKREASEDMCCSETMWMKGFEAGPRPRFSGKLSLTSHNSQRFVYQLSIVCGIQTTDYHMTDS